MVCNLFYLLTSLLMVVGTNATNTKEVTSEDALAVNKTEEFSKKDIELLSKAYGHMIGQNLNAINLDLDAGSIISGIQAAFNGAESPLSDAKTIEMITALQEKKFKVECETNLKAAEAFLVSNKSNKEIVQLEEGKLQYKQITKGSGKECSSTDTPIISYIGKYLNGEEFGKSETAEPIALNETIAGFRKAIIGMKVGEKREVYIHPDLGYGASSCLSPNALLTFEIELKDIQDKVAISEAGKNQGGDFPNDDSFADTTLQYENVK
jgi:peptidylprolyl isomerase